VVLNKDMIIYLDMDDVVADWHVAAQEFLKKRWIKETERIPQDEWDKIKHDSRFYLNLPLKPGARELVEYCQQAVANGQADAVRFLTALPHDYSMPWAANDKVWWAHKYFPNIPVFLGPFSHDKWRHCEPGDILIDDRVSNCNEWRNAGGLSHIYKEWPECKVWLDKIFGTTS
jgi:sulfur relay (sulfurtransferase) DsrC/TusE family protein